MRQIRHQVLQTVTSGGPIRTAQMLMDEQPTSIGIAPEKIRSKLDSVKIEDYDERGSENEHDGVDIDAKDD